MVLPNQLEEFIKQDRKKAKFQTIGFPQGAKFMELQEKKLKKQSKKRIVSVNGYNILDSYKAQVALQSTANQSMSSNQALIEKFDVIYDTSANNLVDEINNSEDEMVQELVTKFKEKLDNYNTAYNAYIKALAQFGNNNANWPNSETGKKYGGKTVNLGGDIGYITQGGFFKWYSAGVLNKQKALDQAVRDAQTIVDKFKTEVEENYNNLTELQQTKATAELEYNDYLKFQELGGDGVCLKDTSVRDLPDKLARWGSNKKAKKRTSERQEECENLAADKGYDYVGYQYKSCWGGNTPGTYGTADNCTRVGKDDSLWGGSWAQNVYRVSEIPQNPNEYDPAIEKIENAIADKESELQDAEKALGEAEAARSKNKCWPAQTGESYELSLALPTKEKYDDSNPSITDPGVQLSSSELNPPMYTSSRMTADVTCTEGEFTNEEDYNYVLENFMEQYKKDLDKAIEEFDEIKEQIVGAQTNVIEGNTNMNEGKTKEFNNQDKTTNKEIANSYDKQKQDLHKYENIKERIEHESIQLYNVLGMNEDSYLNAASRNQQYLMWTFLAILLVTFAITKSR